MYSDKIFMGNRVVPWRTTKVNWYLSGCGDFACIADKNRVQGFDLLTQDVRFLSVWTEDIAHSASCRHFTTCLSTD